MSSILESRTNTVYYLKVYFILYHIEWDYVYPDVKRVQQKCFQIISTYRNSQPTQVSKKGFREKRLLNSDWSNSLTQKWNWMRLCLPGCQTSPTKMFPNYINISKFLFSGPVHYQTKSRKKDSGKKGFLTAIGHTV